MQEILHEGEERGRQLGQRSWVILLLEQHVGSLSDAQQDHLSTLNLDPLTTVALGQKTQRGLSIWQLITSDTSSTIVADDSPNPLC